MTQLALTSNGNLVAMINDQEMYFNSKTNDFQPVEKSCWGFLTPFKTTTATATADIMKEFIDYKSTEFLKDLKNRYINSVEKELFETKNIAINFQQKTEFYQKLARERFDAIVKKEKEVEVLQIKLKAIRAGKSVKKYLAQKEKAAEKSKERAAKRKHDARISGLLSFGITKEVAELMAIASRPMYDQDVVNVLAGQVVHGNYYTGSGRHTRCSANHVGEIANILRMMGVSVTVGNDAPRGGWSGQFVKLA